MHCNNFVCIIKGFSPRTPRALSDCDVCLASLLQINASHQTKKTTQGKQRGGSGMNEKNLIYPKQHSIYNPLSDRY